ncbi:MAG TPA: NIPSNAP family protein [Rhodanobacteraceae bacterium]|nr:NIPSNAP family protein [Rhodanobacteraceae bacterium]
MRYREPMESAVLELRQYTLHPGRRDELIDLFEREFVESQEAVGMELVGTFRDLERPNRFVWIRGFPDMASRAASLQAFYGGPVWAAHREAANATMIDSDNVLLLRPAADDGGFDRSPTSRSQSLVLATICHLAAPADDRFRRSVDDALSDAGIAPIARLETEPAENTFPRLPVRTGEHVFVWLARFDDAQALRVAEARLSASSRRIAIEEALASPPERLVLAPTARSRLR